MLNPIKSLFNYLQKNANTSNVLRTTNDISMPDIVNSSPEGADGSSFGDPLTDPLAIDDVFIENNSDDVNEVLSPTENVTIEIVDIEKLKFKAKDTNGDDGVIGALNNCRESDINGNNQNLFDIEKLGVEKLEETTENIEKEVFGQEKKESDYQSEKTCQPTATEDECLDVADSSSFLNSVNVSELQREVDEITDTSTLLEELRSDGSDSGLGSDSLRSISAIEKNLATLTPSKSSLKRRSVDILHEDQVKKQKRGINFGDVTVFYFTRCQGFGCVPTTGGSTLGMTAKHAYKKSFTLIEHSIEQRRLYRLKMAGNDLNGSSSSSDESKSEDEISDNSLSEGDNEAYGFLQPVTARQRRALLKAAGVRKIDTVEKDECRQLRTSREVCGCTCRGYCDPDTCECSQAGITCQVDRLKPHEFPCGCTRDGCANVNGRIEFNPARVKTHFIHTIMRLELEKRQEMSEVSTASVVQSSSKWWSQMRVQQQSHTPHASTSYTTYPYNSVMPTSSVSQYLGKIPPITSMVSPPTTIPGHEALDLHYAFRDDYNINNQNSLAFNPDAGGSFSSPGRSNDYCTNYNYLTVPSPMNNLFQNGYDTSVNHQHQPSQPASPFSSYQNQLPQHLNSVDCQYSNYSLSAGSSRFKQDQARTDSTADISNGFVNNYPVAMHNGNTTGNSRINYQHPVIALQQQSNDVNPIDSFSTIEPNATTSSTTITADNSSAVNRTCTDNSSNEKSESNENLSDIIKKSIVETVTA